ncbi:MAG: alpha/beta fold hydrolase [Rhizobacter sp.]
MFHVFETRDFAVGEISLHGRVGGAGRPLLLLHGHPQTHVMWHRLADELARRHTVVALDLRGYGDSARPPSDSHHAPYSKRAMAQHVVAVMEQLGHRQFDVCAHDRGARVAHRLALDHGSRVRRLMLLDIAPTLAMYERTGEAFARAYWHWFFLIQPPPLPERLIEADPAGYVRAVMGGRHAGLAPFDAQALAEYERCISRPGSAHAVCEDYRAAATIDLEHDHADRDKGVRLALPLRVLWGAHGTVGRCFDVLALWREAAVQADGRALDCGHYVAEEAPAELLDEMLEFFSS